MIGAPRRRAFPDSRRGFPRGEIPAVRLFHDFFPAAVPFAAGDDAGAESDGERHGSGERFAQVVLNPSEDEGGLPPVRSQDEQEFLPTEPAEKIAGPDIFPCDPAKGIQHPVAHEMAVPVVDGFEVVEVDHADRKRSPPLRPEQGVERAEQADFIQNFRLLV